jgi:hypothetical protein
MKHTLIKLSVLALMLTVVVVMGSDAAHAVGNNPLYSP